jgi:hypothetical protein
MSGIWKKDGKIVIENKENHGMAKPSNKWIPTQITLSVKGYRLKERVEREDGLKCSNDFKGMS